MMHHDATIFLIPVSGCLLFNSFTKDISDVDSKSFKMQVSCLNNTECRSPVYAQCHRCSGKFVFKTYFSCYPKPERIINLQIGPNSHIPVNASSPSGLLIKSHNTSTPIPPCPKRQICMYPG